MALRLLITIVIVAFSIPHAALGEPVTYESLLDEMIDRESYTSYPYPPYMTRQFSSYDRKSTSRQDRETWFANADAGNYLRTEVRNGRTEYVMMDAEGPGAVVRIWSANPKGTIRVYLDGADTPVIEASMPDLLSGEDMVGAPLSAVRSRGWNLYLPIPYAERCVITSDEGGFYYQINYRTYSKAATVESFTMGAFEAARDRLAEVQRTLLNPPRPEGEETAFGESLDSMEKITLWTGAGPAAISEFRIRVDAEDIPVALRSLALLLSFDGAQTVQTPLSDFFATTPGINPYQSWWMSVNEDGWLTCRFVMPYLESAEISVRNLAKEMVSIEGSVRTRDYDWSVQSMHFHTNWKMRRDIATRPFKDWNYVALQGRGVFMGDALSVTNPVEQWWGEGDEKIYVDGEQFPSHFGTGTEDYYGYAWCSNETFEAPFHNQPRCDGPGNYGQTTVSRFRALDAIPFTTSFKFDMEVWHWAETRITYAATTYWYARDPVKVVEYTRLVPANLREIPEPPPLPPPFKIEGTIEGEDLEVVGHTEGLVIGTQDLWKKNTYSGDRHFWAQARNSGDFVEFKLPVEAPGRFHVSIYLTKSWDYGIVQPSIDGESASEPIDTFNAEAPQELGATGEVKLGVFDLTPESTLRLEVVGTNTESREPHYFFGLDAVRLTPTEE